MELDAQKSIALITYDGAHLKTEQLALRLAMKGYCNLSFFALPFVHRKPREIVFAHRPDMFAGTHTEVLARYLGANFLRIDDVSQIPPHAAELFLIAGAGILSGSFVSATRGRVLNAHPGLIPQTRGLDSFKWAVLECEPVGNTLHFIDEEADAGQVVARLLTPVFADDTLHRFAARHYELEIALMANFEHFMEHPVGKQLEGNRSEPRMRMKPDQQRLLDAAFNDYKAKFV